MNSCGKTARSKLFRLITTIKNGQIVFSSVDYRYFFVVRLVCTIHRYEPKTMFLSITEDNLWGIRGMDSLQKTMTGQWVGLLIVDRSCCQWRNCLSQKRNGWSSRSWVPREESSRRGNLKTLRRNSGSRPSVTSDRTEGISMCLEVLRGAVRCQYR
jgi:hypothetical protein